MKRNGFTLVETLVVVAVMLVIMVSLSGVMSGVFNSQTRNGAVDKLDQNGEWIINELKKNVLNMDNSGENNWRFTCPMGANGGSSIKLTNVKDKKETTISCSGGKISSASATTVYLFTPNNDLAIGDCSNFVSCSTLPSLQLSNVKFNFTLNVGGTTLSSKISKQFTVDITLRN